MDSFDDNFVNWCSEELLKDQWKAISFSKAQLEEDLSLHYDEPKENKRYSSGPIKTLLDEVLLDKYNDTLKYEPREWREFIKSLTQQVTPEEITRLKELRRQYKQKIYNRELRERKKQKSY